MRLIICNVCIPDSFRDLVSFVDTLEDFELVSAEMDIELVESRASESGGCVTSLLDLASKSVAQNISCESLECHDPPLDEALLRKVSKNANVKFFNFSYLSVEINNQLYCSCLF